MIVRVARSVGRGTVADTPTSSYAAADYPVVGPSAITPSESALRPLCLREGLQQVTPSWPRSWELGHKHHEMRLLLYIFISLIMLWLLSPNEAMDMNGEEIAKLMLAASDAE